jgi:hypothetical protein
MCILELHLEALKQNSCAVKVREGRSNKILPDPKYELLMGGGQKYGGLFSVLPQYSVHLNEKGT